jgi:hypothetical protein
MYVRLTKRIVITVLLNSDDYTFDGRFGLVVGVLAYWAKGRRFDPYTVQTFVCSCTYLFVRSSMVERSVRSACDRGS